MAEEIAPDQEVDRILARRAPEIAPDELVWEPEPFEDQRAFGSIEPEEPEETEDDAVATAPDPAKSDDMEDGEED